MKKIQMILIIITLLFASTLMYIPLVEADETADELDQYQTQQDSELAVGWFSVGYPNHNWTTAQSFIPTKPILTQVELYIKKLTTVTQPYVVAIRDNLTGDNLITVDVSPDEINEGFSWIEFNFTDISVTPSQTYYIFSYTSNVEGNKYLWGWQSTDVYPNGTSYNRGNEEQEYMDFIGDMAFKTYGRSEDGTNILSIQTPNEIPENESFQVTVTANAAPIENVDVEFNDETKATNSDGQVTFTAPEVSEPTPYTITATLEGYTGDTETITVLNQIEKKGWIYGVVYSESSPLENVKITITSGDEKWVKYTDAEGSYVQSVLPGTYTVEASKQGYTTIVEEDVNVIDGKAIGLDFVLEKKLESSTDESDRNVGFIESYIDEKAQDKEISARVNFVSGEKPEKTYYSDELTIEINSTEEVISFTVAAENGTNGTILVIRIGEGVLEDLDNLNITYDGVQIDEFVSIEEFFDIQGNTTPGWLGFSTKADLYIFVRVPHFSKHEITISLEKEIIETIGGINSILLYIIIFTICILVFVGAGEISKRF